MTLINNRHLASHGLTAEDYKSLHPGAKLMSDAVQQKLSERSVRSNASRKGVSRSAKDMQAIVAGVARRPSTKGIAKGAMSESTKQKLSAVHRAAFAEGRRVPSQLGKSLPQETRDKIAASLTGRSPEPSVVQKALATKRERGQDLAFFRGRSHTEESRAKIAAAISRRFQLARADRRQPMLERVTASKLLLLNNVDEDVFRLRCLTCDHEFTRTPQVFQPSKWSADICDQCFPLSKSSKAERDIADLIQARYPDTRIIRSDLERIAPLELDLVMPDHNLAIEFCGLYWHSELAGKHRFYHRHKREAAERAGLHLLTIFEDEWTNRRSLVEAAIWRRLGACVTKLNARACRVVVPSSETANAFLAAHHMQGRGRANVHLGLELDGQIVAAMTFNKSEISRRRHGWEINRFCTLPDVLVRGAAGRLFRRFVADHSPTEVVSYADLRWGTGGVYGELGFAAEGDTVPNYWYFRPNEMRRHHRYALRKSDKDPPGMTEWEARQAEGWNRIFDCGHRKWVWSAPVDHSGPSNSD